MSLATELIDYGFEGYEKILIDADMNSTERHCGPDEHTSYAPDDVSDFHIDFVQHYEHVRLHSKHIELRNIKHENEGHYECIVRLRNGLVGVRVFFLSGNVSRPRIVSASLPCLVGGEPRQIKNRETALYSEVNDSLTILCPIFAAAPAWYTFLLPGDSAQGATTVTGQDYLRLEQVSTARAGTYTCRVTAGDEHDGFSRTADVRLEVYGSTSKLSSISAAVRFISQDHRNTHTRTNTN